MMRKYRHISLEAPPSSSNEWNTISVQFMKQSQNKHFTKVIWGRRINATEVDWTYHGCKKWFDAYHLNYDLGRHIHTFIPMDKEQLLGRWRGLYNGFSKYIFSCKQKSRVKQQNKEDASPEWTENINGHFILNINTNTTRTYYCKCNGTSKTMMNTDIVEIIMNNM